MIRELTCIVCPKGCQLKVELEGKNILSVSGYTCKRGEEYARAECTSPVRTVTTTVRCKDGAVVAVKTSSPIPKSMIFDVMREINALTADNNVKIGDVVIANVLDTGSDIVVTSNK